MDSMSGDSANMAHDGWWAQADRTSSQHNYELIPAGFTREYHVLVEVCASMSSGFMLLNQRGQAVGGMEAGSQEPEEQVVYSNPSALRLLGIGKGDLVSPRAFDVREHLLTVVAD